MDNMIYRTCLSEACNYSDPDAYVSDLALSSIWGNESEEIPPERIDYLKQLWIAVHRTVRDICKEAGLNQRQLAEHFCVPLRTVENWCTGSRECPEYTKMMMQEILGLYKR